MLNVNKELYHVRTTLAYATTDGIVSGLADAYAFMHEDDPPRRLHHHGQVC